MVEAAAPYRVTRFGVRGGAGGALHPETFATDADRVRELQRYLRKQVADGHFSGVVLVAKDGKPLYHEVFGIANRDTDTPNRLDTNFNLGSANKNFTAIAIGQLVEEGKLSWDDPLSTFIPDFPDSVSARKVRIKHLLSHTSGLGSYFNQTFMESSRARWRTVDDMMRLARPDSLAFEPGTRFAYSNTGFLVLGKVIEVVTGRDTLDLMRSPKPELGSPRYGYGFVLFDGPQYWGNGGDFEGVDADVEQFGTSGYTMIILANSHMVNDPIKRKVRALFAYSIR